MYIGLVLKLQFTFSSLYVPITRQAVITYIGMHYWRAVWYIICVKFVWSLEVGHTFEKSSIQVYHFDYYCITLCALDAIMVQLAYSLYISLYS